MKTREKIRNLQLELTKLRNKSSHEILATISDLGVKGRCYDPRRCVMKNYLYKKTRIKGLSIDGTFVKLYDEEENDLIKVRIPKNVSRFISEFDYGFYPMLREKR